MADLSFGQEKVLLQPWNQNYHVDGRNKEAVLDPNHTFQLKRLDSVEDSSKISWNDVGVGLKELSKLGLLVLEDELYLNIDWLFLDCLQHNLAQYEWGLLLVMSHDAEKGEF